MARQDIINRTADALPDLCAQTGLTALLSVWGNAGPTVVRWERAAGFIVTTLGLGTTMPLIGSATGQVFLAHSPVAVIEAKLTAEGAAYKDSVVQDLIAQVHSAGFGCVAGDLIPGLAAVSAPVLNSQNHIEAAVTLISTDSAIVSKDCPQVSALKAFCASLSVQMPV
jgi:DNA-binding IclR family transcriptional regulator